MTLPDIDTLLTLGGALQNYSAVVDPTVDRDAGAVNQAYTDIAAMTRMTPRAWVSFSSNGAATPTVQANNAVWGSAAPTLAHVSTGVISVTWPTTVTDEIPNGLPGYVSGHTINLRAGWANMQSATLLYIVGVTITAPNVAQMQIWNSSGTLVDTSAAVGFDVFVI